MPEKAVGGAVFRTPDGSQAHGCKTLNLSVKNNFKSAAWNQGIYFYDGEIFLSQCSSSNIR